LPPLRSSKSELLTAEDGSSIGSKRILPKREDVFERGIVSMSLRLERGEMTISIAFIVNAYESVHFLREDRIVYDLLCGSKETARKGGFVYRAFIKYIY
jgi:hypothetical protein